MFAWRGMSFFAALWYIFSVHFSTSICSMAQTIFVGLTAQAQAVSSFLLPSISPSCSSSGGLNSSRSIRNMILDSIYDTQNFGKG